MELYVFQDSRDDWLTVSKMFFNSSNFSRNCPRLDGVIRRTGFLQVEEEDEDNEGRENILVTREHRREHIFYAFCDRNYRDRIYTLRILIFMNLLCSRY